jgi:hypothetical protein
MRFEKYILLLVLSACWMMGTAFAQTWPKYYGEPDHYDYSDDIIEIYDKGYLLCGNYLIKVGNVWEQYSWLVKTDINGNSIWEKIIEGGDDFLRTLAVDQTDDGGILACGLIWTDAGKYDPYVMKLNACGEREWCKIFAGSVNENPWAQDIEETATGDIVVLINQWGTDNIEDMYLFKLSGNGDVLWQKPYCSGYVHTEAALPYGESLLSTNDNKTLIAGEVYWEDPWNPGGPKALRPLYVMVDSMGNEQWVLPFGLHDTIHGQGKSIIKINSTYLGLAVKWPADSLKNIFIEITPLGKVLNKRFLENHLVDPIFTKGVLLHSYMLDSSYYMGGIFATDDEIYISEIAMDTNLFNNPIQINYRFFHTNEDEPYSMSMIQDKKILSNSTFVEPGNRDITLAKLKLNLEYDSAYTGNYAYDSLCMPGPPQSGFIYLNDCDIVTGIDIPSPEEYYAFLATIPVKAYPNPAQDVINFEFQNTEHHQNISLACHDVFGRIVHEEIIASGQRGTQVNISSWAPDLYLGMVKSGGKVVGWCKFLVR